MTRLIFKISKLAAILLMAFLAGGCREELPDIPDYTRSGEPVTVEVALSLPEMEVQTRADLPSWDLDYVKTIWVRTYSADSGQATSAWVKASPETHDTKTEHTVSIKTQSGYSYIVAVANPDNAKGVTADAPETQVALTTLLSAADTWKKFLDIAVCTPSTYDDVYAPTPPLVMVGCFTDIGVTDPHPALGEWGKLNFQPYFIPAQKSGNVTLSPGAIHMRRVVSQVHFNVIPGKDVDGDPMNVKVNSYRVLNVPKYSWLYERTASQGNANFGDLAASESGAAAYYVDIATYPQNLITTNSDGSQSFDFWQGENKHTGTSQAYAARDKLVSGSTSLFSSLVSGDKWEANNEATYVLISCSVSHEKQIKVGADGEQDSSGTTVWRTGEVTYLVHLGYIGGQAKDFNCYRNVDYTYNITVNGIDDIRVNAYATDPSFPGEEGLVSDLDYITTYLDCHYAAFNVQMSQAELNKPECCFLISTYRDGELYQFDSEESLKGADEELYDWIELRPTTGENVLAEYKPQSYSDGKTFPLTRLASSTIDGTTTTPWQKLTSAQRSTSGWYTVFVKEYVYESSSNEHDSKAADGIRPKWMTYVNQNPRRFYILVNKQSSPDGKSVYSRSKYGVVQQSIQSYYSTQVYADASSDLAGTAVGIEHDNETLGLNLAKSYVSPGRDNGRYNVWQWVKSKTSKWANFIQATKPLTTKAVAADKLQGGPAIPARTHSLPAPAQYSGTQLPQSAYNICPTTASRSDYIEAINACMSRNRDNNGNGTIDVEELRWYVPARNKYLAAILGRNSLLNPIMDYQNVGEIDAVNDYNTRYVYYMSDDYALWSMEGLSTSPWQSGKDFPNWVQGLPWQVRCVRNLGTNLAVVSETGDNVHEAYVHDADNRTVKMTYYDLASIRVEKLSGNGTGVGEMPVHLITNSLNKVYRAFQYSVGQEVSGTFRYDYKTECKGNAELQEYIYTNPCADLNTATQTGWRVPNQKELAIMSRIGIFDAMGGNAYGICCSASYFNKDGAGGTYQKGDNYFLATRNNGGTQLSANNFVMTWTNGQPTAYFPLYVRCVRDVEP